MNIQWNKVTWYSKLLAIVLFVLTFYIGFNLGEQKREINTNNEISQKKIKTETNSVQITTKKIKEENFTGSVAVISGTSVAASESRKYIEQTIVDFRTQADTDVPALRKEFGADSPTANYEIDINAKYVKSEKTESIAMIIYMYTGGAHGNSSYKVITTDATGKILALSDVIKKNRYLAFAEFVKKELNNWRPEGSDTPPVFEDYVKDLNFDSFANWSMDDKNLIIYFSQYEIGPGVLGAVEFPLSLEKVKGFLQ